MNIINKWILNRAEKIKKVQDEIKKQELSSKENYDLILKSHKKLLKSSIEEMINDFAKEYESNPEHIQVGDGAIMNNYSIGREGRNGWDGGVLLLLKHIPKEERTKPVTVKITKLYVDLSLSHEYVDGFFNEFNESFLYRNITVERVKQFFIQWRRNVTNDVPGKKVYTDRELIGLYKTAHFDYDGSFKPKWGLSINSFLKEGTPEYDTTYEIWTREIDINIKREELNQKLKELDDEKKQIDEKYKNIKYVL
jgi:hypothetical protein